MIHPTHVFTFAAPGLITLLAIFSFVALYPPLREYRRHQDNLAVKRRSLVRAATRLVLLSLLFPPFVWAITEGRWGATIRLRERELVGTTCFGRFLGKVDLDGVSLRLEQRRHSRGFSWVLVGAKKWETLRIDGFVDAHGQPLLDLIRADGRIPVIEVR